LGIDIFWYLPTQGDERYLGAATGRREPTFGYLKQVAQAVDDLGYGGMLLGTGVKQDAWIVAASLIPVTRNLKFLVAVRPSIMTPALSARMAATFDVLSEGRCLLNVVTGGSTEQLESDGVFYDHDTRYEVTDEFLHIWRALAGGEAITFDGKHLRIRNGRQQIESVQRPYPPLYFGGSSGPALDVAAKHVDVYLQWGEPPAQAAEKIETVRRIARDKYGRHGIRFGMRFHAIARETEDEAWAAADRLISLVDDATVLRAQSWAARSESVGQKRMAALHGDIVDGRPARTRTELEIHPNLWSGVGLVRGGAGTALVGSPASIVRLLGEYQEIGVDTFVLSGYPALEESYYFAELVFPHLDLNHRTLPATRPRITVTRGWPPATLVPGGIAAAVDPELVLVATTLPQTACPPLAESRG
jgi:alkanesulfonate monooxygenase